MTSKSITRYVRYAIGNDTSYGVLEGDTIHQLSGDLFANPRRTGKTARVSDVKLLVPVDPARVGKVIGVTGNHDVPGEPRTVPHPRWFAKLPTALNPHEGDVELPPGSGNLNYEGELVVIIGKGGRHISMEAALGHVFGFTVGNDWSENTWYGERNGLQDPSRLVAKGMDTWACVGTTIVSGIDHTNLDMQIRLNGEVVARGNTKNMTNKVPQLISYISYFVTLLPGDMIYTSTVRPSSLPGARRAMQHGDVVEVEIEGIGVLRNRIVALQRPVPVLSRMPD